MLAAWTYSFNLNLLGVRSMRAAHSLVLAYFPDIAGQGGKSAVRADGKLQFLQE